MKKRITIVLTILTLSGYAQNKQSANVNVDYYPSVIFETKQLKFEGNYMTGGENFQPGVFITTDDGFKELVAGLFSHTKILTVSKGINFSLLTGIGIDFDLQNEDQWGTNHHAHYVQIGLIGKYDLTEKIYVQQYWKNQYWNESSTFVAGIGVGIKIK